MDAPARRQISPADIRSVRMLAHECRLSLETAKWGPARMQVFMSESKRHILLLRGLLDALTHVVDDGRTKPARRLAGCRDAAWRAWLASLCAGNRRKVWHHRVAFTNDAIAALLEVDQQARACEKALWDG